MRFTDRLNAGFTVVFSDVFNLDYRTGADADSEVEIEAPLTESGLALLFVPFEIHEHSVYALSVVSSSPDSRIPNRAIGMRGNNAGALGADLRVAQD